MGQQREIVNVVGSFDRVGFDTSIFIYHIEQASRWAAVASDVLRAMAEGRFAGLTSILTLLEIGVKPLRLGRPEVADAYEALLLSVTNLTIVDLDARAARIGAELRATYGMRTPDALHIGACLADGAEAFVTNDRRLRQVKALDIVVLDDFV